VAGIGAGRPQALDSRHHHTSYWAIGESPRTQVRSRNTVDLEAGILSSDPITKLGFKSLPARGTTGLVVMGLQGVIVLGREDHGIKLTRFFHGYRFAFGLSAKATKTLLGQDKLAQWPETTLFVTYCAGPHCNGAARGALRLAKLGRPVKIMAGGITGWIDEDFELATSASPA